MKLTDIMEGWEVVYVDEDDNVLEESAVRQFKKDPKGNRMLKKFRCTSGPKSGKLVSSPAACSKRVDPKRRKQGRKIMRTKGKTIARKSKVTKKKSISKILTKLNAKMMGKPASSGGNK